MQVAFNKACGGGAEPIIAGVFGIGGGELVAIVLIALIVLGPDKLPGVARTLARLYKEFTKVRKQAGAAMDDIRKELSIADMDLLHEDEDDKAPAVRSPEGETAARGRVPLDQMGIPPAPADSGPRFFTEPLPVPELDDYLSANDPPAGDREAS